MVNGLDARTKTIISDMRAYLTETEAPEVTIDPFYMWFCLRHPTLDTEQQAVYKALLTRVLTEPVDPMTERGILPRLLSAEYANNVTDAVTKFNNGDEIDIAATIKELSDAHEIDLGKKTQVPWVNESIGQILQADIDDSGLRWRLKGLDDVLRPLRGGDFIIYAGRVGKGKTTGVLSEVTYMVPQFDRYYGPNHGRSLIWLCNEGPGRRIVSRAYQSALNATLADLIQWTQDGSLDARYAEALGGNANGIRVMNVHGFNTYQIESILSKVPPGLIVIDMLDNVKFSQGSINGGDRSDETLEAGYQWARLLGVKYECPVIATSQTNGLAHNMQYPGENLLKGSTTGKQGAAETIIMMGSVDDYPLSRFISVPKLKEHREGAPVYPRFETVFDGERARVLMPTEEK